MRKFLRLLLSGVLIICSPVLMAQQKTVTGTVVESDDSKPMAGVTVKVKGTDKATQTNENGVFSISVSKGQVLQFSYVGHKPREITVGDASTISVSMINSAAQMNEVVVTALDIKRSPRELGYSTPKLAGGEISQTQRENFLNSLQGRVAGLTVTSTSGQPGSSSNIVLRGFNSLTGSNQPLFVIDGVIVDNSTFKQGNLANTDVATSANRNTDYSNRISDLNPNDIETYTVLKGPEATALYGSQAASGAIIITTKKAKPGKLSVSYDNNFRTDYVTRTPSVQSIYDVGRNGQPSSSTRLAFGPRYAPGTKLYDNVGKFFQNGISNRHNLALNWGKKNFAIGMSTSFTNQKGIVPTTTYTRSNYRIFSNMKMFKGKLEFTPSIQMISTTSDKAFRGSGGFLLGLLSWPQDDDASVWLAPDGTRRKLTSAAEDDNPYFNVFKNKHRDVTDRYIYTASVNYTFNKWLNFSGRFGYDYYKQNGYTFYHPESNYYVSARGRLETYQQLNYYYNHTMLLTAKKKFGDWNLRAMVGTAWEDKQSNNYGFYADSIKNPNGQFGDTNNVSSIKPHFYLAPNQLGKPRRTIRRALGIFGEVGFGFRDYLYGSFTLRRDELSTLPPANRAFYYPSASMSFIFSDAISYLKNSKVLSFGKLRASIAKTGKDIAPYQNQSTYEPQTTSGGGYAYGFTNANPYLVPEKQLTYEIGTEMRFLNDRIGLDFSYYNTLNTDVILSGDLRLSYGTGFILNTRNIISLRNEGIEFTLNGTPVKNKNFRWDVSLNANRTWNKALDFPPNVLQFYVSDTWLYGNARAEVFPGGNTTTIGGYTYERNNAGKILIDPTTGLPSIVRSFSKIGDRNAAVVMGFQNNFRYKNWGLSFLWDFKIGGDIFNGTEQFLWTNGYSTRSIDRETPRVISGVLKDGLQNTSNPTTNTIQIVPFLRDDYYRLGFAEEDFIEKNINWARLRDVTLSYNFGKTGLKALRAFKSLSFNVTVTDLILWTNYSGVDPSVNGNTPAVSGVGGFGFDFGNVGTPVGINFGIKAGF